MGALICLSSKIVSLAFKDKTVESAVSGVERWSHTYGLPLQVRSDQGPCFGPRFSEWSRSVGINHCVSAAYNPQSNGAAERVVASIKAVLTKMGRKGKLSQEEVDKMVFKINKGGECIGEILHAPHQNIPARADKKANQSSEVDCSKK